MLINIRDIAEPQAEITQGRDFVSASYFTLDGRLVRSNDVDPGRGQRLVINTDATRETVAVEKLAPVRHPLLAALKFHTLALFSSLSR